jgi:hypothetical protein
MRICHDFNIQDTFGAGAKIVETGGHPFAA